MLFTLQDISVVGLLEFALDIASALQYLYERNYVLRSLKASNCL